MHNIFLKSNWQKSSDQVSLRNTSLFRQVQSGFNLPERVILKVPFAPDNWTTSIIEGNAVKEMNSSTLRKYKMCSLLNDYWYVHAFDI